MNRTTALSFLQKPHAVKLLSMLIFFLCLQARAVATPAEFWTYGGSDHDGARYMELTSGGKLVVTGFLNRGEPGSGVNSDLFVYLIDPVSGMVEFSYTYAGAQDINDVGMCVRETNNGEFIVVGVINAKPPSSISGPYGQVGEPWRDLAGDVFVMLLDATLTNIWPQPFIYALPDGLKCGASFVTQVDDFEYVICGGEDIPSSSSRATAGSGDYEKMTEEVPFGANPRLSTIGNPKIGFLLKIREAFAPDEFPMGAFSQMDYLRKHNFQTRTHRVPVLQWHHTYRPDPNEYEGLQYFYCVREFQNDQGNEELVAVGTFETQNDLSGIYLVRLLEEVPQVGYVNVIHDPDGDQTNKNYEAYCITEHIDDGFVITGFESEFKDSEQMAFIWKISDQWGGLGGPPQTEWFKVYNCYAQSSNALDSTRCVHGYEDPEGNITYQVTGFSIIDEAWRRNILLLETDVYGYCNWCDHFGGPQEDEGYAVIVDNTEQYLVAGYSMVEEGIEEYFRNIAVLVTGPADDCSGCGEPVVDVATEMLVPGQYSSIQGAINAAEFGDIITVADGTFSGEGFMDLDFLGKTIYLRSENGPENCVINCDDGSGNRHRGVLFHMHEGRQSILEGFSIINGYETNGAGIYCQGDASPTIRNCYIQGNQATNSGGGICARDGATPTITNCLIAGNSAGAYGGGIFIEDEAVVRYTTISGNLADLNGGGIYLGGSGSAVDLSHCIVWGNGAIIGDGSEVYCSGGGGVHYCCCDVNSDGIAGSCGLSICDSSQPNINEDPIFCDFVSAGFAPTIAGDYFIDELSPCAPAQQPDCGLLGALGVGCGE